MDMLGSPKMCQIITKSYLNLSLSSKLFEEQGLSLANYMHTSKAARMFYRWKKKVSTGLRSKSCADVIKYVVYGTKTIGEQTSTARALFVFPAMYPYYQKALKVYRFEAADGIGRPFDLVIQGFIRFSCDLLTGI